MITSYDIENDYQYCGNSDDDQDGKQEEMKLVRLGLLLLLLVQGLPELGLPGLVDEKVGGQVVRVVDVARVRVGVDVGVGIETPIAMSGNRVYRDGIVIQVLKKIVKSLQTLAFYLLPFWPENTRDIMFYIEDMVVSGLSFP